MKPVRLAFTAFFAAAAAVLLPATARAQYGTGYGTQNTGPDPALVEARKQIQAAEKDVARLRQEQQKFKVKLQAKYETKDEWETAKTNLKKAETAYDLAKKKAMAKLIAQPNYKAAKEKLNKSEQQVTALEAQGDRADLKALSSAQQARLDAGLATRKMEKEALDNDPKSVEAKEKVAEAKKAWEALQDELDQALEQDPDYQQAKQEMETAQANVQQMKLQLQQQQAQAAAARRQQMDAERQSRQGARRATGGGRGAYGR